MKKYYFTIIILLFLSNLFLAFSALAQEPSWVSKIIGGELIPGPCRIGAQPNVDCSQSNQANCRCTITDLVTVGVNIAWLILGLVGTAALAMFIYGGVLFLISGGSQQKVSQAKSILVNAVIGILIVFSAWVIVNFVINALTKGREGLNKPAEIFNTQRWDQPLQ